MGSRLWCGFCSHLCVSDHFCGRTVFSLCNTLSKEHTKYITKQYSLPGKMCFILVFVYEHWRQSSSDFSGTAPGPVEKSLPYLKCPRIQHLSLQHPDCSVRLRGRGCKTALSHRAAPGSGAFVTPSNSPGTGAWLRPRNGRPELCSFQWAGCIFSLSDCRMNPQMTAIS